MITGFENDRAMFFAERQVDTADDPYSDDPEPVYDWVPLGLEDDEWEYVDGEVVYDEDDVELAHVRVEQRDAEYVREVYGEWPADVYRVYAYPKDVGTIDGRKYELEISADDRVELHRSDGRFVVQEPNLRRLDSAVPEYVQLEVSRVGL
ncbi:hypothetical protein [Natrarchaeobaculum sulfurireducens]|uniref:Uncharacterized protein n=1 Tax=Natrarchaeobaculum sulfurireducens TaxID=2044521 RepID=A0A346PHJ3_9EURY|nr:hypothetical protein [Natrarchaeobaculum sulfurireducens]AXR78988.1 hypothetical protein AArc1_2675 [Natrarchaeobaculum sulfurireducens]